MQAIHILLIILGFILGSEEANAKTRPGSGSIIALVNLECPYCRELYDQRAGLEAMVNSSGLNFVYAPMPNHTQAQMAWAERAYYASRSLPGGLDEKVMGSLYDAQDAEPLRKKEQVLAWLQMTQPQVEWDRFFKDKVEAEESLQSVEKAILLAKTVGLTQFPTFLYVTQDGPVMVAGTGEIDELVNQLKRFLENIE